jgi:hypothetical protein
MLTANGKQVYLVPTFKTKIMNWIKRLFKKQKIAEPQTQALNIPVVSGRSEQLPDAEKHQCNCSNSKDRLDCGFECYNK